MRHILSQRGSFVGIKKHLSHGLHIRGIQLVQLFDIAKNLAQIVRHAKYFFVSEPQIRQIGDVMDFLKSQFQAVAFLRDS